MMQLWLNQQVYLLQSSGRLLALLYAVGNLENFPMFRLQLSSFGVLNVAADTHTKASLQSIIFKSRAKVELGICFRLKLK